jgi:hypothetical protein
MYNTHKDAGYTVTESSFMHLFINMYSSEARKILTEIASVLCVEMYRVRS